MDAVDVLRCACVLAPGALMTALMGVAWLAKLSITSLWRIFHFVSLSALGLTFLSFVSLKYALLLPGPVFPTPLGVALASLVQLLGTVIATFSARYLEGEANQRRYVCALAGVLSGVHLLLLSDHWMLIIGAWAAIGIAMQRLLCFYPDRSFAALAAHKKFIADRLADLLLLGAASLAYSEVGSGSLTVLRMHIDHHGLSLPLQASAALLVLAIGLRTALLPVHGWLIQVMEAPTPVSALLHAGVVNLGGFVLIRFAPLLEQAAAARVLLLLLGLATAVFAGMVTLTRISIKVRLAWSTVAQMGFMLLECALGLYTLAALHLVGHSLYKAQAFLSASSVVRETRKQALHCASSPTISSVFLAPVLSISVVFVASMPVGVAAWPWWWSVVLGLAWAPLLWLPAARADDATRQGQLLFALLVVSGLTLAAKAAHLVPLGLVDAPANSLGVVSMIGMTALYLCQGMLQIRAGLLSRWRRWSYAGFYLDEAYTRLALRLWPVRCVPETSLHLKHNEMAKRLTEVKC